MKYRRDVNTGGALALAKPSNSGSHGKSQPDPREDATYNEARDRDESWRQAGDGPSPFKMDGAT